MAKTAKKVQLSVVEGGAPPSSRKRASNKKPSAKTAMAALGLAQIERREGSGWVVRVGAAARQASLASNVDVAFAEECMRDQRTVLITDDALESPVVIVGALQTSQTVARDAHDTLELSAERISINAGKEITLRAGQSTIRIDKHGVIRVRGQKMSMDVANVVRIMSALVELP